MGSDIFDHALSDMYLTNKHALNDNSNHVNWFMRLLTLYKTALCQISFSQ